MQVTNIMLVVERALLRDGLRALLSQQADLRVVGDAPDAPRARALGIQPEVVVLDVGVPGSKSLELTRQVALHFALAQVVGLSSCVERSQAQALREAGLRAWVSPGGNGEELLRAIRLVARGEAWACAPLPDHAAGLSPREAEVLRLIAEGFTSKEMATQLTVAISTVETYRKQLMLKLGLHSVAALTRFAIRVGLAPLE